MAQIQAEPTARVRILDRIRKLAKMTAANGASESEAMFAATMLAKLMGEHAIAQSELSLRTDARGCVTDSIDVGADLADEWTKLGLPIARLFACKVWRNRGEDALGLGIQVWSVKFFGYPEDVLAATVLATICLNAINAESVRWKKRTDKLDFRAGMIDRLVERIRALHVEQPKPTGALVVLKTALVQTEYDKLGMVLRSSTFGGGRVRSAQAYAAGQSAGSRVDLGNRGRVGGSTTRRLS